MRMETNEALGRKIHILQVQLVQTTNTLGALITWIAQSSNSPISVKDAKDLLEMLNQRK